jgi:hypothetical protein
MTITSELSKIIHDGNGSTTSFTVPFDFARAADLYVVLLGVDGEERLLTLESDYAVQTQEGSMGGSVVLATAPQAGTVLAIRRDPALLQETVYEEGVSLSAKSREQALDLLTMLAQANRERVDRSVKFRITSQTSEVTMPEPGAGRTLVWNDAGTDLENGPTVADVESAAANAAQAAEAREGMEAALEAAQAARDEAVTAAGAVLLPADPVDGDLLRWSGPLAAWEAVAAEDVVDLSPVIRSQNRGFAEVAAQLSMPDIDFYNRRLDTFEGASNIDAGASSGYEHDDEGDFVRPSMLEDAATPDLSAAVHEDVKGAITTLVVDTANTSGHFTDGTNALALVGALGTDVSGEGTPFARDTRSGYPVSNAFDDNTGTEWATNTFGVDQVGATVGVTWAGGRRIKQISYRPGTRAFAAIKFQYYDGASWIDTGATHSGATANTTYTINLDAAIECLGMQLVCTSQESGGYEGYVAELGFLEELPSSAPKVVPGCVVVLADSTELTITGVTNRGDGADEVAFSGTLAAGSHVVSAIHGTVWNEEAGALALSGSFDSESLSAYDGSSLSEWTMEIGGSGQITQTTFDGRSTARLFSGPAGSSHYASMYRTFDAPPDKGRIKLVVYHSVLGTWVAGDYMTMNVYGPTIRVSVALASDGIYIHSGSSWVHVAANTVEEWNEWWIDFDAPSVAEAKCNVYRNGVLVGSDVVCAYPQSSPALNGRVSFGQFGDTTANLYSFIDTYDMLANATVPSGQFYTATLPAIDHNMVGDITGAAVTGEDAGQTLVFAMSFDGGTTYTAWDGDSWEVVGTDSASGWMSAATLEGVPDADWPEPGGDVLARVGLETADAGSAPTLSAISLGVLGSAAAMSVVMQPIATTGAPQSGAVWIACSMGDTPPVLALSRDGGTNWDEVDLLQAAPFLGTLDTWEGELDAFSHEDGGGNALLARLSTPGGGSVETHFMSVGAGV